MAIGVKIQSPKNPSHDIGFFLKKSLLTFFEMTTFRDDHFLEMTFPKGFM
jgi:hypothetical protein